MAVTNSSVWNYQFRHFQPCMLYTAQLQIMWVGRSSSNTSGTIDLCHAPCCGNLERREEYTTRHATDVWLLWPLLAVNTMSDTVDTNTNGICNHCFLKVVPYHVWSLTVFPPSKTFSKTVDRWRARKGWDFWVAHENFNFIHISRSRQHWDHCLFQSRSRLYSTLKFISRYSHHWAVDPSRTCLGLCLMVSHGTYEELCVDSTVDILRCIPIIKLMPKFRVRFFLTASMC